MTNRASASAAAPAAPAASASASASGSQLLFLVAGVQLGPNGFAAFDALGIGEIARSRAVHTHEKVPHEAIDETLVGRIPTATAFRERFGNPCAEIHRADIHGAWFQGAQASRRITVATGTAGDVQALKELNLVPLWPSLRAVLPAENPQPRTRATHWPYAAVRRLDQGGRQEVRDGTRRPDPHAHRPVARAWPRRQRAGHLARCAGPAPRGALRGGQLPRRRAAPGGPARPWRAGPRAGGPGAGETPLHRKPGVFERRD